MKQKKSPHKRYPREIYRKIYQWDIKNNPGGILGRLYLRRWSVLITRLLAPLPVVPNHLTSASILFALFSLMVTCFKISFFNIWAAVFVQICLVLGYADGDMARLKKLGNRFGGWFDGVADMIKINIIYFTLAVGDYVLRGEMKVFFYLSLLISTRLILSHIAAKTTYSFADTNKGFNELVGGGIQIKLAKFFRLDPSFITFSDDIKFFMITLSMLLKQYLLGIFVFIILHLFLITIAFFNVWQTGKEESLGDIGWRR